MGGMFSLCPAHDAPVTQGVAVLETTDEVETRKVHVCVCVSSV